MPPEERFVVRFAAEPPQEILPTGRWAETLKAEFLAACLRMQEADEDDTDLGDIGELAYHPDRTWAGRTFVPITARTTTALDVFGFVSYVPADPDADDPDEREPGDFVATADFTDETAENNPEWKLDLCDEVIGGWRGENGRIAAMTLIWGTALVGGGAIVTAELANLTVDQCALMEDRFTLIAPDNYKSDFLEICLYNARGRELAVESLYDDDGE
jgi:hypothetical protein